jgi:hypothetical protein
VRAALLAAVLLGMPACATVRPGPATGEATDERFPRDASRFELRPASDTTLRFAPAEVRWIRPGLEGIAVNPAQGDALVARFRVVRVDADSATALVTGQTTRLAPGHVALLVPPRRDWWRERLFWWGAAAGGGLLGVALFVVLAL